jgi:hypothetical protein|tara:strand:- start:52 stop:237 length:186 start_codon:yes stop_codon:yes gene_type:complete
LSADVNPCILNNFILAYYSIYIVCGAVFFAAVCNIHADAITMPIKDTLQKPCQNRFGTAIA